VALTVDGIATAVAGLSLASQKELGELFGLLVLAPARLLLAGVGKPWREASVAEVSEFLQVLATSRLGLLQRAYGALHDLTFRRLVRASRHLGSDCLSRPTARVSSDAGPDQGAGLAAGWKHIDASTLARSQTVEADVVIVGTGAGGGVTADILSEAGLRVSSSRRGRCARRATSGCARPMPTPSCTRNRRRARRPTRRSTSCRGAASAARRR
jgi:hypothetical protein